MSEAGLDLFGGRSDGGGIVEVDGELSNIVAFTFESGCRLLSECLISRAEKNRATRRRELADHFETDTFIRPRDESDFLQWAWHTHLASAADAASMVSSK